MILDHAIKRPITIPINYVNQVITPYITPVTIPSAKGKFAVEENWTTLSNQRIGSETLITPTVSVIDTTILQTTTITGIQRKFNQPKKTLEKPWTNLFATN